MTTLLWCFHLFGNSDQEFSLFSICFFFCVKEKSPRLLRNEVPDNVPEFSGPFFVVLINSFLFFQTLCGVLLPVCHLFCPEFDLLCVCFLRACECGQRGLEGHMLIINL